MESGKSEIVRGKLIISELIGNPSPISDGSIQSHSSPPLLSSNTQPHKETPLSEDRYFSNRSESHPYLPLSKVTLPNIDSSFKLLGCTIVCKQGGGGLQTIIMLGGGGVSSFNKQLPSTPALHTWDDDILDWGSAYVQEFLCLLETMFRLYPVQVRRVDKWDTENRSILAELCC